jgi:hypothetical protein
VNYLSHFVVDHIPGNIYYNTGLLLPDVTKKWIKRITYKNSLEDFPLQIDLLKGCEKHYESDKKFHSSDFFNSCYLVALEKINASNLSIDFNRKWFVAHVVVELLLDRNIVKQQRSLADAFYQSLNDIDEAELTAFLVKQGMADPDAFFSFFNHFRSVQYIYHYTDNNKLMYSLTRIMQRAGLKETSAADMEVLLSSILETERILMTDANNCIAKMKETVR